MARNKARAKKVKTSSQRKKFDTTHLGGEPQFEEMPKDPQERKLAKWSAMNWYSYFYDRMNSYDNSFFEYCKTVGVSKKKVRRFKLLKLKNHGPSALKLIRMKQRGWVLDDREKQLVAEFFERIERLGEYEEKKLAREAARDARMGPKQKIVYSNILYELDDVEDEWMQKRIPEYNLYDAARIHNASKGDLAGAIKDWVQRRLDDMYAHREKNDQAVEGYNLTAQFRNKIIKQLEEFRADIDRLIVQPKKKIVRRTKKAKIVPADKKIKWLKFQKESNEHKLVSIDPTKVIKAMHLVVFNTKYRVLTLYKAADEKGFDVRGTTLQNVDLENSKATKLRKPEEVLPEILKTGSVSKIEKIIESQSTKTGKPNARINDATILMKVIN